MPPVVRSAPSIDDKLTALGGAAAFDLSCACGGGAARTRGPDDRWIYPAVLPSGGVRPMLKVLQQGGCERGCTYCAEREGGGGREALGFLPDELAALFVELHRARRVFGLFLSSAIRGGAVATMDRMLATAEILRGRFRFGGYLHLKIVPGCRPDQVDRAMDLATRVSVNLEAPTAVRLASIAPSKGFDKHLLAPMRQVAAAQAAGRFRRSGQTTQLVVGATDESDQEIAHAASRLYRDFRLARVYYSGFQPVPSTPLAERRPAPFLREHRLYQVDFLLRDYGFAVDEIRFDEAGRLPLDVDPKTRWAEAHPERFPIEVNRASPEELVRVPGIGPRTSACLVAMRKAGRLSDVAALRVAGVPARAGYYLLLAGKRPEIESQLELFAGR